MEFITLDKNNWNRKDFYNHYFFEVPCTYSLTAKIDITRIIERKQKLYPSMLYYITTIINRHEEFRTAINENGELGIYSTMIPCYTIFNNKTQQFSNLWTMYYSDIEDFVNAYQEDKIKYSNKPGIFAKPDMPANNFTVSMIPWTTFDGFTLNIKTGYDYLLPIFTMGKYYKQDGKTLIPLSIQVHHAVCDGFHVCRFINELQELIDG